jgi:DNA-binding PadR family transcriptional regulator
LTRPNGRCRARWRAACSDYLRSRATSATETNRMISVEEIETEVRSSPLALAVLSLLHAAPLHPYAIQRLLKEWGKDNVINVGQRANLYKTIKRLLQAGLITVRQTERDQQYPERTVYELTEAGRRAAHNWLTDMVVHPRNEFPQFPAALSFLMMLTPDEARAALEQRASALRGQLAVITANLANLAPTLPRVTLMDDEYVQATISAELAWIDGVVADLSSGALSWSYEELAAALGAQLVPIVS